MIRLEEMIDLKSFLEEDVVPFEEFKEYLYQEDYQKAVSVLPSLEIVSTANKDEYYLYLFLLNQLELLPADYSWLKDIKLQDSFTQNTRNNEIRKLIDNFRTIEALKILRAQEKRRKTVSKEDTILINLLQETVDKSLKEMKQELLLGKTQNFETLQNLLEQKESHIRLNPQEKQVLIFTRMLLSGEEIKMQQNTDSKTLYEAIAQKDYEKAREINQAYHQGKKTSINLLEPILDAIIQRAKKSTFYEHLASFSALYFYQQEKVKSFLEKKGQPLLYPVFQNLLCIGIVEEDVLFEKANTFLQQVKEETYQYSLFPYLLAFSEEVVENPLKASFYLDILKQGEHLGQPCPFMKTLEEQLKRNKDESFEEKQQIFKKIKNH